MGLGEIILCRSEDCLKGLVMFSLNGQLLVVPREEVFGLEGDNLFFTNRDNRLIKNALSSPAVVQIQITNRCNLLCKHCYVSSGKQNGEEMSDNEIKQLLLNLRMWGVLKIQWVGGEVFVRKGFLNLVSYAKSLGFEQSLLTNGIFFGLKKDISVSHSCWDYFYTIQVSIDDFGEKFNNFVGKKHVWEIVCKAIENLSESKPKGKILSAATIIREDNLIAIPKIAKLLEGNVDVLRLGKEIPTGRSLSTKKTTVRVLFDSWKIVEDIRKSKTSLRIGHPFDKRDNVEVSALPYDWKSDNGARTFMYISSEGLAYPFPLLVNSGEFCGGSVIDKNNLDNIWLSDAFTRYRSVTRQDTGCGNCKKECQMWPRYHFIDGKKLNLYEKPFSHPGCPL